MSLACHRTRHVRHFECLFEKQVQVVTETGLLVDDRYYRVEHMQHRLMVVRDAFMLGVEAGAIAVMAKVLLNSRMMFGSFGCEMWAEKCMM